MEIELSVPRQKFGAVVTNNCIFIGGGVNRGSANSEHFEKINIETGERLILSSLRVPAKLLHLVEAQFFRK